MSSLAQEPADAEYENIPRSAIRTKLVDIALPAADAHDNRTWKGYPSPQMSSRNRSLTAGRRARTARLPRSRRCGCGSRKRATHFRRHGVGVAAHEDRRPLLNQLPDFVLVGQHLVLDMPAPVHGLAGKHGVQAHHPAFLEIAQLVFVNVVLRVAAAEEQHEGVRRPPPDPASRPALAGNRGTALGRFRHRP